MEPMLFAELKKVVELLEKKKYESFFSDIYRSRIGVEDYYRVLEQYGGNITIGPDSSYDKANIVKFNDGSGYGIDYNLWIDGSESDLSLIIDVIVSDDNKVDYIEISDIHVL